MDTEPESRRPHSAEYFGEDRDHWWDADFVSVLVKRWGIAESRRVLDVGCGVGHWGRVLMPHLPAGATLVGVDREAEWVEKAGATAAARGLGGRMTYVRGEAERLPFPDGSFDLATCQTVLIHVPDPAAVIREMVRVVRPGGRVLVAEPNNMAGTQLVGGLRAGEPVEQRLAMTRFQLVCERGKAALGEGDNSVGERAPGMFLRAGLADVSVCQSSRASPLLPPYESPAARALRAQVLDWASRDFWVWSREDTRRYFLAGGGGGAEFDGLWTLAMRLAQEEAQALRDGTYDGPGGLVCYLIVGTRPVG